jgi:hypothetical protein
MHVGFEVDKLAGRISTFSCSLSFCYSYIHIQVPAMDSGFIRCRSDKRQSHTTTNTKDFVKIRIFYRYFPKNKIELGVNFQFSIYKFVKHFKNLQQIDYATDHDNYYANRERNCPRLFNGKLCAHSCHNFPLGNSSNNMVDRDMLTRV